MFTHFNVAIHFFIVFTTIIAMVITIVFILLLLLLLLLQKPTAPLSVPNGKYRTKHHAHSNSSSLIRQCHIMTNLAFASICVFKMDSNGRDRIKNTCIPVHRFLWKSHLNIDTVPSSITTSLTLKRDNYLTNS